MDKRFPLEDQIAMLASALRGRVIMPNSADYDAVRVGPIGNGDRLPAAVIRPRSAADVAAVINFARATDLEIAIRSGGHGTAAVGGTDGGILIDLRDLNGLEVDAKSMTAWAGTGLTAGQVTGALEQQGRIIGFGDSASVGIGGITLGGGIGYFARKHGATIDSLLAAEIVTAAGDIVIADATSHPELFWALRGGGGNFGVVTRMKYKVHALPSFVGGPLVLPPTPEVLAGFVAAAMAAPEELTTIALILPAPPLPFVPPEMVGRTVLAGMMAYAGDPKDAGKVLAPFRALAKPIADLVGPAPFSSMYIPEDPGMRPTVSMRSRFVDRFGIGEAAEMLTHFERCDAPMKIAQVRVLGGAFGRVPADATAFAHRASPFLTAFIAMSAPNDAPRHEQWATDALKAMGQGDDSVYVNFLGAEPARVRSAYPSKTWERLRRVKRQYDPENLFRVNQNIPPAA
jgi:FAD/FMN-containing dehydrogenase